MQNDQFETYQKLLNGKTTKEELDAFLRDIEGVISVHARICDEYSYLRTKWNIKTEQLCSLRDLVTAERSKYDKN